MLGTCGRSLTFPWVLFTHRTLTEKFLELRYSLLAFAEFKCGCDFNPSSRAGVIPDYINQCDAINVPVLDRKLLTLQQSSGLDQQMKEFKPVIVQMDPKSLTPYARNAKTHTTDQIDKIAGQIHAVGFTVPIVVDKEKVIIAGHGRREAALRLNLQSVPVIIADHLTDHEAMAARIADNKVAEGQSWDNELLKFDLGTLHAHDFKLELTGIEPLEADSLLNPGEISREEGKGIEDYAESHETTDIRQLILIMTAEDFTPMFEGLQKIQEDQKLDNNTEAVKYLLEMYELENNNPA